MNLDPTTARRLHVAAVTAVKAFGTSDLPCVVEHSAGDYGGVIRFATGRHDAVFVQEFDVVNKVNTLRREFTLAQLENALKRDLRLPEHAPSPISIHPWPVRQRQPRHEGSAAPPWTLQTLYDRLALLATSASDETRAHQHGVSLSPRDGGKFVATNGHIICEKSTPGLALEVPEKGCLLDLNSIAVLKKFCVQLGYVERETGLRWEPGYVLVSLKDGYLALRGREENMSAVQSIRYGAKGQEPHALESTVSETAISWLLTALNLNKVSAREESPVCIEVLANELAFSFLGQTRRVAAKTVANGRRFAAKNVHLAPRYLANALKVTQATRLLFGDSALDPIEFIGEDGYALVMPRRV